jgi:hypothetical protein
MVGGAAMCSGGAAWKTPPQSPRGSSKAPPRAPARPVAVCRLVGSGGTDVVRAGARMFPLMQPPVVGFTPIAAAASAGGTVALASSFAGLNVGQ